MHSQIDTERFFVFILLHCGWCIDCESVSSDVAGPSNCGPEWICIVYVYILLAETHISVSDDRLLLYNLAVALPGCFSLFDTIVSWHKNLTFQL